MSLSHGWLDVSQAASMSHQAKMQLITYIFYVREVAVVHVGTKYPSNWHTFVHHCKVNLNEMKDLGSVTRFPAF